MYIIIIIIHIHKYTHKHTNTHTHTHTYNHNFGCFWWYLVKLLLSCYHGFCIFCGENKTKLGPTGFSSQQRNLSDLTVAQCDPCKCQNLQKINTDSSLFPPYLQFSDSWWISDSCSCRWMERSSRMPPVTRQLHLSAQRPCFEVWRTEKSVRCCSGFCISTNIWGSYQRYFLKFVYMCVWVCVCVCVCVCVWECVYALEQIMDTVMFCKWLMCSAF